MAHLAEIDLLDLPVLQHGAGGEWIERNAEHAGEVIAATTRENPEDAVGAPKGIGHRADQPIAAESDCQLVTDRGADGQLARVGEAVGLLHVVLEAAAREPVLHLG